MSSPVEESDIVMVGGGPVGLSAAASLDYYGIKTTVVEMKHTKSPLAKAQFVSSRSVEHFRRIGLEKVVQDASWPRDEPFAITICTQLLNGHTLMKDQHSSWGDIVDGKPGCKFLFFQEGVSLCSPLLCPQTELEPTLKQHLEGSDNVTLMWSWEVTGLEQDATGVTLTLSHRGSGEKREKHLRAKFVIACDGGRSRLRKLLNVHTYGKFVVARAVSIMIKSDELFARLRQITGRGITVVSTGDFTVGVVNVSRDGEYVLHITFPRDTTDEKIEEVVQNPSRYIDAAVGEKVPHTITAISAYNMHGLISTKFRVGHCFFAGDSAHQWVPIGGLGMNTGIGDVFNLTWKLAAVLRRYGGPKLLDSFEVERKPECDNTRRFVLSLANNAGVGFGMRGYSLILSNPLLRFFVRRFISRTINPQITGGQSFVFGYQYINSNIVMNEYDPSGNVCSSSSTEHKFVPATYPGLRAPHVVLHDCSTILDLFGKSFVLLAIGGQETDCRELKEEMEKRQIPLSTHVYQKLPKLVALYDRKYYLIRPDGVISWRSDVQPSTHEAKRIVAVVIGDYPPERLPPFQLKKLKPPSPSASLPSDMAITAGVGSLLLKYTDISFKTAVGAGLGLFWFLRMLKVPAMSDLESIGRHKAAVITRFGKAEEAFEIDPKYTQKLGANDILIRVRAVSVNPIDVKICNGYIASLLQRIAHFKGTSVFPVLLGRDCSGEVVAVGDKVTKFVQGDEVYALSWMRGTYAQLAVVSEDLAALKSESIGHKEATSIAFVSATTYTALVENVGLNRSNTRGKKILVHGGTGGIGSFAIQFLKAWGAEVTVTCSTENVALAYRLGADKAIDYKQEEFSKVLQGYDVVLDTIGGTYEQRSLRVLKAYGGASYVSLVSPRLTLLSKFPPILGDITYSWYYRYKIVLNRVWGGRAFYYSATNINSKALEVVGQMVEKGEIRPVIDAVYSLDEIVAAHQHVEDGHTRGKVVITMP